MLTRDAKLRHKKTCWRFWKRLTFDRACRNLTREKKNGKYLTLSCAPHDQIKHNVMGWLFILYMYVYMIACTELWTPANATLKDTLFYTFRFSRKDFCWHLLKMLQETQQFASLKRAEGWRESCRSRYWQVKKEQSKSSCQSGPAGRQRFSLLLRDSWKMGHTEQPFKPLKKPPANSSSEVGAHLRLGPVPHSRSSRPLLYGLSCNVRMVTWHPFTRQGCTSFTEPLQEADIAPQNSIQPSSDHFTLIRAMGMFDVELITRSRCLSVIVLSNEGLWVPHYGLIPFPNILAHHMP